MKILPESYFKSKNVTPLSDVDEIPTRSAGEFNMAELLYVDKDISKDEYTHILHYLTPEDEVFDQRYKYNIARVGLYKDWDSKTDAFVKHEEDFIAFYDVNRVIRYIVRVKEDDEILIDEDNAIVMFRDGSSPFKRIYIVLYATDIKTYSQVGYSIELKHTIGV